MAELALLQSGVHRPPSSSLDRKPGRSLNTIMEEPEQSEEEPLHVSKEHDPQTSMPAERIVQWLSPRSDHFPTPRGFHFLSAPILPSSPSTDSISESNSPSSGDSPWNRGSTLTSTTEFDDIYDTSENEEDGPRFPPRNSSLRRQQNTRSTGLKGVGERSPPSRQPLPKLMIPPNDTERDSHNPSGLNKVTSPGQPPTPGKLLSPVPPTPPARVEMSPAVMSFLQAQQSLEVPAVSAPPSLDGSLTSDQMAAMSAPATPVISAGAEDAPPTNWTGVQLQPGALATLRALSGGSDVAEEEYQHEQVIEIPMEPEPEMEMQQQTPRRLNDVLRPMLSLRPVHLQSSNGLPRLEIPSPSGFFSGLSPRTRHTWHMPSLSPDDIQPPTSSTAEQFYRCPWNRESAPPVPALPQLQTLPPPPPRPHSLQSVSTSGPPVEQIIEAYATMSDGIPTARPVILEQVIELRDSASELDDQPTTARRIPELIAPEASSSSSTLNEQPVSPKAVDATEIVTVYDSQYAKKLQEEALSNLDRTELWLMAQKAYLPKIANVEEVKPEPEPKPKREVESVPKSESHLSDPPRSKTPEPKPAADPDSAQKKKMVRFSADVVVKPDIPRSLPSKLARQESAYYRAFQDFIIRSRSHDAFVHRLPRFEALQAQRVSLREAHRNQLLGKYQLSVVPQSAKKRMSANVARGDDVIIDDPERLKREKEAEAQDQMAATNWHVNAMKTLNRGRLFSAPLAKRLARLSRMAGPQHRARILDLGGQATCDWGWHCAIMYPNTKVYTTTTKAIRQLSNSNIRGPPNHRQVAVQRLPRLPFADNYFDLISARELQSILKFIGENGEDEWESCLRECMRVLKPGGYLEFSVLDSDIMNAGPLGLAKSVEFGFLLKTLGYDPNPTKLFLRRLRRAGFEEIRRAWVCLPLGPKPAGNKSVVRDSQGCERKLELEAMVLGSTGAAASVTGVLGGWSWERWLLRCEMEKVVAEERLCEVDVGVGEMTEAGRCLEGVSDVVEEGRRVGAGWRSLMGFARKATGKEKRNGERG